MADVDKTGAPVAVTQDVENGAFVIALTEGDGTEAGRARYIDAENGDRIFYHTVVDEQFGGRGLGTYLVNAALQATLRDGTTVVPVCPMVAAFLAKNGTDYEAEGGSYREPTDADLALVREHGSRG